MAIPMNIPMSPIMNPNEQSYFKNFNLNLNLFAQEQIIYENSINHFKENIYNYGKNFSVIFNDKTKDENLKNLYDLIKNKILLLNYNLINSKKVEINISTFSRNSKIKIINIKFSYKEKKESLVYILNISKSILNNKITIKIKKNSNSYKFYNINKLIVNSLIDENIFDLIKNLKIYHKFIDKFQKIKDLSKLYQKYKKYILKNYIFFDNNNKEIKKSKLVNNSNIFDCNYQELLIYINDEKKIKNEENKRISNYSFDFLYMSIIVKNLYELLNFIKHKIYFILMNQYIFSENVSIRNFELLFNNYFKFYNKNINSYVKEYNNIFVVVLNNKNKLNINYSKFILGSFTLDETSRNKSPIDQTFFSPKNSIVNTLKINNQNLNIKINNILVKYNKFGLIRLNLIKLLEEENNLFTNIRQNLELYKKIFHDELFDKNNNVNKINHIFCKILNYYLKELKKSNLLKFICFTKENNLNKLYCNLAKNLKNKKDLYIGYLTIDLNTFIKSKFVTYQNFSVNNLNKNLNTIFPSNFVRTRNNTIKINQDLLLISLFENRKTYKNTSKFITIINSYIKRVQPYLIVICSIKPNFKTNFESILKSELNKKYDYLAPNLSKKFKTVIFYNKEHTSNKNLAINDELKSTSLNNESIYNQITIENEKTKKFIFINGNDNIKNLIDEYNLVDKYNDGYNIFLLGIIQNYEKQLFSKKFNIEQESKQKMSLINKTKIEIRKKKQEKIELFYKKLQYSMNRQIDNQSIIYIPQKNQLIIKDLKKVIKIKKEKEINTNTNPICLKVNLKL
jgi:hypothetical protein